MASASPQRVCFQFAKSGTCRFGEGCKFDHIANSSPVGNPSGAQSWTARASRRARRRGNETELEKFFAQFPTFSYDLSESATTEFYRLCDFFGWEKDEEERNIAHESFRDAVTKQFNNTYGTDAEDINSWQHLCKVLEITPIPENLEACRNVVRGTHVNLIDLIDIPNTGREVEVFNSVQDLSDYTKATGKFFPKENAYAGGLLKFLLREILNPPPAHRPRRSGGRSRRAR